MAVNWSFYEGSRLSHSLKMKGLLHHDDMIIYLLIALHRDLNNVASDNKDVIDKLAKERKEVVKKSQGKILHEEVKPIPRNK